MYLSAGELMAIGCTYLANVLLAHAIRVHAAHRRAR